MAASPEIVIFSARKVLTMNPARPVTTHVAVQNGKILGSGTLEELAGWGEYTLNEQFADKVLMPGFVEGHSHTMEGMLWRHVYCGFFDRMDPNGVTWEGLKNIDSVIDRLVEEEAKLSDPAIPLTGWAIDPIYYENKSISRQHLDQVSATRPIGILHASGHILNVNTKALELAELFRTDIKHDGIPMGKDGYPTGELKGPDVMTPAGLHVGLNKDMLSCDELGLRDFGRLCVRKGVTTATDLATKLDDATVATALNTTSDPDYPARIVALRFHHGVSPSELIEHTLELKQRSTDKCRLGRIKVVADGSIQGFSARINWPGYYNGAENGLWYIAPEHLSDIYQMALRENIQVHTHTNGDEATDLVLDTLDDALRKHPSFDHRFTIQHGQLISDAQFRRIAKLGCCVNLFANHHFYWGDEHYQMTVGPERATRMNSCRSALDNSIPLAIHSDAPVTPLGPLFTAWSAVNRITSSGRTQGDHGKISVDEALYAITIGAAYTLNLDAEIGSIESGKRADFAVLESDPTEIDPKDLKSVEIWGTVFGGHVFSAQDL
ncbi:MAG: amidohydrolase [Gammaproteobacteria bacterium]|nr:amidohydrolase [Gammaproteobacteria bacterium]